MKCEPSIVTLYGGPQGHVTCRILRAGCTASLRTACIGPDVPPGTFLQAEAGRGASAAAAPSQDSKPAPYAFTGMQAVIDQSKAAVTALSFGRLNSELLAFGSDDGCLRVARVGELTSSILHVSVLKKPCRMRYDLTDKVVAEAKCLCWVCLCCLVIDEEGIST